MVMAFLFIRILNEIYKRRREPQYRVQKKSEEKKTLNYFGPRTILLINEISNGYKGETPVFSPPENG